MQPHSRNVLFDKHHEMSQAAVRFELAAIVHRE